MSFHIKIIIFTNDLGKRKTPIVKSLQLMKMAQFSAGPVQTQAFFGMETFCKRLELGVRLMLS